MTRREVQHFIKVHSFAKLIGEEEHLDEKLLYILEAAAYVHDIGIRPAEAKFGRCDGKLQEHGRSGRGRENAEEPWC